MWHLRGSKALFVSHGNLRDQIGLAAAQLLPGCYLLRAMPLLLRCSSASAKLGRPQSVTDEFLGPNFGEGAARYASIIYICAHPLAGSINSPFRACRKGNMKCSCGVASSSQTLPGRDFRKNVAKMAKALHGHGACGMDMKRTSDIESNANRGI